VIVLASVLALALVAAGLAWQYATSRFDAIATEHVEGLHRAEPGQPFNVLVVGSDTRDLPARDAGRYGSSAATGGQRSDVIMVLRVEPTRQRITQLSIPRDLVVPIAGTSRREIIAAAFEDGPSRLVRTIEETLGVPVNHYVLIDFSGFKAVIDELGGIDVEFPYQARDTLSGLRVERTGCQRIRGEAALALARSRHYQYLDPGSGTWRSDPLSDLGRIRRQQAFLYGVLRTAKERGLTNPLRANRFVRAVSDDLAKDDRLRLGDVIRLAARFRSFDPARLTTATVPTRPLGQRLVIDQPKLRGVIDRFLGRTATAPAPGPGAPAGDGPSTSGSLPSTSTGGPGAGDVPGADAALRPFDPRPC